MPSMMLQEVGAEWQESSPGLWVILSAIKLLAQLHPPGLAPVQPSLAPLPARSTTDNRPVSRPRRLHERGAAQSCSPSSAECFGTLLSALSLPCSPQQPCSASHAEPSSRRVHGARAGVVDNLNILMTCRNSPFLLPVAGVT
jgi:hypothetical protein